MFFIKSESDFHSIDIKLNAVRANYSDSFRAQQYSDTVRKLLDALDKAWDDIDAPKKQMDDAGFKEFTNGMKIQFQGGPPER